MQDGMNIMQVQLKRLAAAETVRDGIRSDILNKIGKDVRSVKSTLVKVTAVEINWPITDQKTFDSINTKISDCDMYADQLVSYLFVIITYIIV